MPTNVYVLLDRSGSMQARWAETIGTINGFVSGLGKSYDGAVTLVTFDSLGYRGYSIGELRGGIQFEVVRAAIHPEAWQPLAAELLVPRGGTPLHDAIGRLGNLVAADANPKGVVVIMTDGEENESREITREGAKSVLDRIRERGWEVIHLGADFDAYKQAHSLGTVSANTATITRDTMRSGVVGQTLAAKAGLYASGASGSMAFSAQEKAVLSGEKKQ